MRFIAATALLAVATVPAAAMQGRVPIPNPVNTAPVAGATVFDPNGGEVGKIASVTGDVAVIDTGTHQIGYPIGSIGPGAKGPTIALTKVELDTRHAETLAKAAADLNAALAPGTSVRSRNGTASVGTIKSVDAQFVTLTTVKGDLRFPRTGFSLDQQGLIIGFTADEFNKAIGVN